METANTNSRMSMVTEWRRKLGYGKQTKLLCLIRQYKLYFFEKLVKGKP